jgi:D-sedoheptulose 7-phosphate isomerase
VPSNQTPRIQETHILLGHVICELIDRQLFPEAYPAE